MPFWISLSYRKYFLQRQYFNYNNLKLSYLEDGAQHAKKILITHANGYAAGCYSYILEALAPTHHVVALDFAGYGESEGTLNFSSWNFFRDQVFALLEHKSWKTCVGIGHSLGGGSLLRAAELDSTRFEMIIALDPVLIGWWKTTYVKLFGNPMAKVAIGRRSTFKDKNQALKIFDRHPANRSWDKRSVRDYVEYCIHETGNGAELRCTPAIEARTFSIAEYGALLRLKNITCETHFMLPPGSGVIPGHVWRKIVRNNPASTCDILPGVGHLFPFEKHDFTLRTVSKYLQGANEHPD